MLICINVIVDATHFKNIPINLRMWDTTSVAEPRKYHCPGNVHFNEIHLLQHLKLVYVAPTKVDYEDTVEWFENHWKNVIAEYSNR